MLDSQSSVGAEASERNEGTNDTVFRSVDGTQDKHNSRM